MSSLVLETRIDPTRSGDLPSIFYEVMLDGQTIGHFLDRGEDWPFPQYRYSVQLRPHCSPYPSSTEVSMGDMVSVLELVSQDWLKHQFDQLCQISLALIGLRQRAEWQRSKLSELGSCQHDPAMYQLPLG
jgi:hypothetical protein